MQFDSSAFVSEPELVQRLEGLSSAVPCDVDRVLFRRGEFPAGLYILHEGAANLTTRSIDGKFAISLQTTAGSLLGLPSLFGRKPHTYTAVARRGARLSFINREDFSALIHSDPTLHLKVMHTLAAEVEFARMAIIDPLCVGAEIEVAAA
jgi:CRP-like cAMP-binding protein